MLSPSGYFFVLRVLVLLFDLQIKNPSIGGTTKDTKGTKYL